MATEILILTTAFLLGIGFAVLVWFRRRYHKQPENQQETEISIPAKITTFRLRFIILPLAILLLCIILTAYFYRLLPAEVAYRFKLDGSPDGWLSREATTVIILAAQFALASFAWVITWGITKMGLLSKSGAGLWFKPERLLTVMGNMLAIPQVIIFFAALDIFSYNAYQVHIMPLWLLALIVLISGTIILGVFFLPMMLKAVKDLNQPAK